MKFSQMDLESLENLFEESSDISVKKSIEKEINLRKANTKVTPAAKRLKLDQNQTPVIAFPTAQELIQLAQQNRAIQNMFFRQFPPSLVELAKNLIESQLHVLELSDEYESQFFVEKAKICELSKQEELRQRQLLRDSKRAKERKKYIQGLRGLDKKIVHLYGKTLPELQAEMIEAFKKFQAIQQAIAMAPTDSKGE